MSSAVLGLGTLLQLSDGASSPNTIYTSVAEIVNIAVSANDRDAIDVTHHESTDAAREFIAGLLTGATIQLDLNFLPAHATHKDLTTNLQATSSIFRTYRIVFPDFGAASFATTVVSVTNLFTTASAHSWLTGQPVRFTTTGSITSTPQIYAGKTYYARVTGTQTFKLYPTSADATADTNVIDVTADAGTHTFYGGTSWTFSAHVNGFEPTAVPSDKLRASPRFKITSSLTIAP